MSNFNRSLRAFLMAGLVAVSAVTAHAQLGPPIFTSVSFGNSQIPLPSATVFPGTTLSFNLANSGTLPLTGVSFTANLAPGLKIATPNGLSGACGVPPTAVAGATSLTLSAGTLAGGGTCSFTINVIGVVAGLQTISASGLTSTETAGGNPGTATASIEVVAPPVITKAFLPTKIQKFDPTPGVCTAPNCTSRMTFTVANPSINNVPIVGLLMVDSFFGRLEVAANPNLSTSAGCAGAVFAPPIAGGASSIIFSYPSLPTNTTCTFAVDVIGITESKYTNNAAVTTSNTVTGSATADITIVGPPRLTKTFSPVGIKVGDTSTLTFNLTSNNIDITATLSGINFTDTLPAGLTTTAGSVPACGGTLTTTTTTISLAGAALGPNANCSFNVTVTGTTVGLKHNVTSVVGSQEGGNGAPAVADLTVLLAPTLLKTFNPISIPLNGMSTASFLITNPNTDAATGILANVGLTDSLPAGLVVAAPPLPTISCIGTFAPVAGATSFTLNIPSLAANASCTVTVKVTGTTRGLKTNTATPTSSNGPNGTPSTATLLVIAPAIISKAFLPTSIPKGSTTTLTFTLNNPNLDPGATLTGVGFTDPFPGTMVVATPLVTTNNCGPTFTAVAGASSVAFAGGTLAPNAPPCTISVEVTSNTGGPNVNNTTAIASNEGGPGNIGTGTLNVVLPPSVLKSFLPTNVLQNGLSTMSFVITNDPANTEALIGLNFLDTLPAGLQVANPNLATNTCGGSVLALPGSSFVSLSGGTVGVNSSCTITISVTPVTLGDKVNSVTVSSTNGGTGNTSTATLSVTPPRLLITKAFLPISIPVNSTSTLTFNLTNPGSAGVTGVAFSDTLPLGLVASPTGISAICGGSLTVTSTTISLTGGVLGGSATCPIIVTVTGTSAGLKHNISSTITSSNTNPGDPAVADLTVIAPPSISKSFSPSSILVGGTSVLTLIITNPPANIVALTGVSVNDPLPAGLIIATPSNAVTTCGGILDASAGSSLITLSGATLAINSTCSITVTVTATTPGDKVNSATASSTNGGPGTPGSATLRVGTTTLPPTLTKAFATKSVLPGGVVALTFVLKNNNALPITGVAYTDNLPAGLTVATPNGLVNTCTGTATAVAGSSLISVANVSLAANASCTLTVNVLANAAIVPPVYICNTTSTVAWSEAPPEGDPATTCITIGDRPIAPPGAFQIRYASHLDRGDSLINLSNNGANGSPLNGPGYGYPVGNICINAYAFSPDEQLISCCSCLVTPNGLNSLSVREDLTSNTLTGVRPNSVVIKLLASQPVGSTCNAATPNFMNFAPGMHAWGTTIHPGPTGKLEVTETPFSNATLHEQELARLTGLCANNLGNGSGFGVCRTCRNNGFGQEGIVGSPAIR